MGPPVRQRYNAKARQSTLGGSAHKKRRRSTVPQEDVPTQDVDMESGSELDMIMPGQKEAERQSRMDVTRREMTEKGEQMSSKKRKRLDAFIVRRRVSKPCDGELLIKLVYPPSEKETEARIALGVSGNHR